MPKHTVAIVGCGPRGRSHAKAFLANSDRFDLVAICDLDEERLQAVSSELSIAKTYTDADAMLAAEQPDVFCFCTLPHIRLPLIELGVKHGVKAIAYEKPMATSLAEAQQITTLWDDAETRNEKALLEGLQIKAAMGVPQEQLWREMGYDADQIEEMMAMKAKADQRRANLGSELLRGFDRGEEDEEEPVVERAE